MKAMIAGMAAVLFAGPAFAQKTERYATDLASYANEAAARDLLEVKASQLALQRSQDPAIRQFAQHMVAEHTDSTNKLKLELEKAKIDIDAPNDLDPARQVQLDTLMNTATEDFNKSYITMQIATHEEALKLHGDFAKAGSDVFRKFAGVLATQAKQHLDQATRIGTTLPQDRN